MKPFNYMQTINNIAGNHLTVSKQVSSGPFKICYLQAIYLKLSKHIYIYIYIPDIGIMVRVFANSPGDLGSIPGRVIPKTQKMVLDATLLNTLRYKLRIKSKVKQSRERSSALGVVAIEKGAFGSPSTTVSNFTYLYI